MLIDYDGTLTPIVKKPELANLSLQMKECLQELAGNPHLTLGIISGRTMEDLQERVGLNGIIYVGNHGLEIEGPGITYVNPVARETKPFLHSLCQDISKELAGIKGAIIEDKGLTLSLHYRLVDEAQVGELNRIFCEIAKSFAAPGRIKVGEGRMVYEVKPAVDWDKGKAIALIAQNLSWKGEPLTIFLGDDVTDYDGFRMVDKSGGISIYVGEEDAESVAQYLLCSPKETYQFLSMLREVLKPKDN
ncbi:trehalose-phosphatase [Candidatus Aerophobetes bacterium]|nr:trehalose-phosphatase [Candidatus Aerophobetes bacterium]